VPRGERRPPQAVQSSAEAIAIANSEAKDSGFMHAR
jgi:hypothetical protein